MTQSDSLKPEKKTTDPKLLGIGFDSDDGQVRLTRGKNYSLLGGSEETHSMMQETAIRVNEKLDRRGKTLSNVEARELEDILHESIDAVGTRRLERN